MSEKKRTPATRVGSGIPGGGAGYGGPAKGSERKLLTADNQPSGEAKSAGKAAMKTVRERLAEHHMAVAERWIKTFDDKEASPQVIQTLGEKIFLFGGIVLEQRQIVESENVHRIISDEPMTEADWTAQYATPADGDVGNE